MGKFLSFFAEDGGAKRLWNSLWIGIPLWFTAAAFTFYWLCRIPTPGKAVTALAVVAGVMSVREEIKILGKISWVLLLICPLITEFRAIDKDDADKAQAQKDFFATEKQGFEGVNTQAQKNFSATAGGLQAAIDALNRTVEQTRPRAKVMVQKISFAGLPPGTLPGKIKSGIEYEINFDYLNFGQDTATSFKYLAHAYVDEYSEEGERKASREFLADWHEKRDIRHMLNLESGEGPFNTISRTFTPEEVKELDGGGTIFVLIRFEYTDQTGKWGTDYCQFFQRTAKGALDMTVTKYCTIFNRLRYSIKPQ